ncbi:MAG: hypothetical protein M0R17_09105 [Candidatus Omnitrophica bacterium]|jgi:DNA polymerase III delta prime subunit|nr:hypothetical protein [Candidatus Omnitrophota bacterium]
MVIDNSLWTERYRPQTLKDFIGNDQLKAKLQQFIDEQDISHLLLSSHSPGTGKTSISKILVNSIKCDHMYINASDENNVETVRTKIKTFASTMGYNDKKIIILDECFETGTLVNVLRGNVDVKIPIEQLDETNDLIKSYSTSKHRLEWRAFKLFNRGERELWQIEFDNGEIVRCTEEHKWYIHDNSGGSKLVLTKDLTDYILSPIPNENDDTWNLQELHIKKILKTNTSATVYDLTVDVNHNFFVTDSMIMTSNCDFTTPQFQAALRNLQETFSKTTRFILTCNYPERIIEPLQSRCQMFNVVPPSKKEIAVHIAKILVNEKIDYNNKDVATLVNLYYPDIRRIINACQQNSNKGILQLDTQSLIESNYILKIIEILKSSEQKYKKINQIRQVLVDSKVTKFEQLYKYLYDEVDDYASKNISGTILTIAEAQYQDSFVVEKEINVAAMFVKLINDVL